MAGMVKIPCRLARVLLVAAVVATGASVVAAQGWPEYGGSLAGQRYSAAKEINRGNVSQLEKDWALDVRQ